MLHAHVYVEDALFTQNVIPCGAMEEVYEFNKFIHKEVNFAVNIKGHGSIVLADNLDFLNSINFYARTLPELQVEN